MTDVNATPVPSSVPPIETPATVDTVSSTPEPTSSSPVVTSTPSTGVTSTPSAEPVVADPTVGTTPAASDTSLTQPSSGTEDWPSSTESAPVVVEPTEGQLADEVRNKVYADRWQQHTAEVNAPLTEADGTPIIPWTVNPNSPVTPEEDQGQLEDLTDFVIDEFSHLIAEGESIVESVKRLLTHAKSDVLPAVAPVEPVPSEPASFTPSVPAPSTPSVPAPLSPRA